MEAHLVADKLRELARLMELAGGNPYRIRALQQGSRIIGKMEDFAQRLAHNSLTEVPGIGEGLNNYVMELISSGKIDEMEQIRSTIPDGVLELLTIPGIGPAKARTLWQRLDIVSVEELETACREGRVANLPGMGEKIAKKILQGIEYARRHSGKYLAVDVWPLAVEWRNWLGSLAEVSQVQIAGELSRRCALASEIILVAEVTDAPSVVKSFVERGSVEQVLQQGPAEAIVKMDSGPPVALHCVDPQEFNRKLHYFIGSMKHHEELRLWGASQGIAIDKGDLSIVKHGQELAIDWNSEAAIYDGMGLPVIPPALREGRGEVAAAAAGQLAGLVELDDLRGIFHCHTTYSDGKASLREMARAAAERGWDYLGISDHSQSAHYAGGLDEEAVQRQFAEIDGLNAEEGSIRLFRGIESDILKDGSLDYSDDLLARFDFVIASIHTHFSMPRAEMTQRICRALRHPATRILAHPTGRLLLSREPFEVDMDAVLRVAGEEGVVVEINCNPRRSELDWRLAQLARSYGVRTMISPDAHTVAGLDLVRYGTGLARKGWWPAEEVINTWPLERIEEWLQVKSKKIRR